MRNLPERGFVVSEDGSVFQLSISLQPVKTSEEAINSLVAGRTINVENVFAVAGANCNMRVSGAEDLFVTVAVPVSVNMPDVASNDPVIPKADVNARTSSPFT